METNREDSGTGLMGNGSGGRVQARAVFISWLSAVLWEDTGVRGGILEEEQVPQDLKLYRHFPRKEVGKPRAREKGASARDGGSFSTMRA